MSSYTITITPDDASRGTTTLRVDDSDGDARITELLVRPTVGAGLTASQLPAVDLDLLLRAVNPGASGATALAAPAAALAADPVLAAEPAVVEASTVAETPEPAASTESTESAEAVETAEIVETPEAVEVEPPAGPVAEVAAAPVPRPRKSTSGRGATKKAAAAPKNRGAGRKAAEPAEGTEGSTRTRKAAAAKPGRARTKKAEPAVAASGRNYRKSPDDLALVFQQAGSAGAIADHYNVPRHTAQAWIRTLKRREQAAATVAAAE